MPLTIIETLCFAFYLLFNFLQLDQRFNLLLAALNFEHHRLSGIVTDQAIDFTPFIGLVDTNCSDHVTNLEPVLFCNRTFQDSCNFDAVLDFVV